MNKTANHSTLGQITQYPKKYKPDVLFPIPRSENRKNIGINEVLPFCGYDIWQEYELSWLNFIGKPNVAIAQFIFPCTSPYLIESKSLKLYLHSLNDECFNSCEEISQVITSDLSQKSGAPVKVNITPLHLASSITLLNQLPGFCLDELDIQIQDYTLNPNVLSTGTNIIEETLYSHLLKSNCLVTKQPDWGTIQINYTGAEINRENLLKYIISFRNHCDFAENCVERVFMDIQHYCKPTHLTVAAFFTRRGGKDINPIRSTVSHFNFPFARLIRQ